MLVYAEFLFFEITVKPLFDKRFDGFIYVALETECWGMRKYSYFTTILFICVCNLIFSIFH